MLDQPIATAPQSEEADDERAAPARARTARENRLVSLLLVARLITRHGDQLCRVRNISSGGLMIETGTQIAEGERIRVELRKLQSVEGTIVWTRAPQAGVQFLAPIEVARFLGGDGYDALPTYQPRSPRLVAECPVRVRVDGRGHPATLVDISQTGGKLRLDQMLTRDGALDLRIPGLEARRAAVRWVRDDEVGISFLETLSFTELGSWLEDHALRFAARADG